MHRDHQEEKTQHKRRRLPTRIVVELHDSIFNAGYRSALVRAAGTSSGAGLESISSACEPGTEAQEMTTAKASVPPASRFIHGPPAAYYQVNLSPNCISRSVVSVGLGSTGADGFGLPLLSNTLTFCP